ncbi:hypothetical protein JXI42_08310 [bacterium]|nr:hypothetical protein [bacterium]
MNRFFICIPVLLFLVFSTLLSETGNLDMMVLGFKQTNLDEDLEQIIIELFKSEFTASGIRVINLEYSEIKDCYDLDCALTKLEEYDSKRACFGELISLGEKIIIAVHVVNPDSGGVYFSERITINEIEDLDIAVKRLTAAVVQGKSTLAVITKETITSHETEDPRRRRNFYTFGLRIGYLFPLADTYGESPKLVSYSLVGAYEMQKYIVEARFTINSGDYSLEQAVDFSLLYSFYLGDFSPYLAAGLGVHWVNNDNYDENIDYSGDGPAFNIGGGLFMFQTYDFRFWLDVRYSYLFLFDKETTDQHGISVSIGVTHRKESGGGCSGIF